MKKGVIYILVAAFLFSTMEVVLKLAGTSFNAIQLTFLRFTIGGFFLLPFAVYDLKKRHCRLTFSDWIYLFVLGIICICFSMTLFQIGVMRTNASLAAVIISMNPVFTMVFAHLLSIEKFTIKKAIVLLLSLTGLVIAADPFGSAKKNGIDGVLMIVVAAVAFGLYTAMGKKRIAKIGGMAQTSFSFLTGSAVLLPCMLAAGIPVLDGIKTDNVLILLYIGIFVSGIGYYLYLKAVEISGPSTASLTFFIKPVFAPILALIVLNEAITVQVVLGVAFIVAGSIFNVVWRKEKIVKSST